MSRRNHRLPDLKKQTTYSELLFRKEVFNDDVETMSTFQIRRLLSTTSMLDLECSKPSLSPIGLI